MSLELAARLLGTFSGRGCFVPLAGVPDAAQICPALLEALRAARAPGQADPEALHQHLGGGPRLLVLDNFEQLVPDDSAVLTQLLERPPRLQCVVTSRRSLRLGGEREFPLAPLEVPGEGDSLDRALEAPSLQLFRDRAQGARPEFEVTPGNREVLRRICNRLAGLPLTLELAAMRVQVPSPSQILKQLEHRLGFLTSGRADLPPRHRVVSGAPGRTCRTASTRGE